MPIHLPPTSRRSFLHSLALGGAALAIPGTRAASARRDEPGDYVALMADCHIDASPDKVVRQHFNLSANLRVVVDDILAQPKPPSAVAVLGDLALKDGQSGDYAQFLSLLKPIRERGIPVHLTLGNHDDRDHFRKAIDRHDDVAAGHCASIVEAAGLRLAMLDTLDHVNDVPGFVGGGQLAWLAKTLDAAPNVPTLVLMHHHPSPTPEPPKGALQDTAALMDVIRPRKQVKALLFGHTHVWQRREVDGVHCVNLPAVAYHFETPQPLGWCRLEPRRDGSAAMIELNCTGGERSHDGERVELAWRGA